MTETTPNLGMPLIDPRPLPDGDSLAEGAAKLRTAMELLDTVYQQIVNQQQAPDAGTLGGQDLAFVLALANATGLLPVAKVDGFDAAWDAKLAAALNTAPATLDTLLEIVAEVQDNDSAVAAINTLTAALQSDVASKLELSDVVGKHTIWLPASSWTEDGSAAPASETMTTGSFEQTVYQFSDSVAEKLWNMIKLPKSYDGTALDFRVLWKDTGNTGDVRWAVGARSFADDDPLGTANEAETSSLGSVSAVGDLMLSPWTTMTLTSGGSDELLALYLQRDPVDVSDTMTGDAQMIGVELLYTTNAATDD